MRATVRNSGKAAARASLVSVALKGMRAPLARAKVTKLKRGKKLTVPVPVTFPKVIAPGRYRIVVCADAAKKVKERSEANNCRTLAQVLQVTAGPVGSPAPGPVPPVPTAVPAGVPTPTATATATATDGDAATATATPRPRATPVFTPAPETPPEDLPALLPDFLDEAEALYDAQDVESGAIAAERAAILKGRTLGASGDPLAGRDDQRPRPPRARRDDERSRRSLRARPQRRRAGHARLPQGRLPRGPARRRPRPAQLGGGGGRAPDPARHRRRGGRTRRRPRTGASRAPRRSTTPTGTRTSTVLFAPGTTADHALRGRQQPAAPGALDGPPDRVHGGRPRRDAGHLPANVPVHLRGRARHRRGAGRGRDLRRVHRGGPDTHAAVEYVENFIGAPVGSGVPSGSYDRAEAEWEPEKTGRVVKVVSETAGRADLDTDGDGDSDGADYPAALKITDGERAALAPLYQPGASSGASRSTTSASGTSTGVAGSRPGAGSRGSAPTAFPCRPAARSRPARRSTARTSACARSCRCRARRTRCRTRRTGSRARPTAG